MFKKKPLNPYNPVKDFVVAAVYIAACYTAGYTGGRMIRRAIEQM